MRKVREKEHLEETSANLAHGSSGGQSQPDWGTDYVFSSLDLFLNRSELGVTEWYADLGASQHMSDQRWMFINFKPIVPGSWPVKGIGSGRPLQVHGQGDIPIRTRCNGIWHDGVFQDALYVPKLGANLFSVRSATKRGFSVLFTGVHVNVCRGDKTVTINLASWLRNIEMGEKMLLASRATAQQPPAKKKTRGTA